MNDMPKVFFICGEEHWLNLGDAFRTAGFQAPHQARCGMNKGLMRRIELYNRHKGMPIEAFVVDQKMAEDGVSERLAEHYPGIPVFTFSFHDEEVAQKSENWKGYPVKVGHGLSAKGHHA